MLSPDEATQIAKDLAQARLDPVAIFIVGFVIGKSVAPTSTKETTSSRDDIPKANGAALPAAKGRNNTPAPRSKRRKAHRKFKPGEAIAKAREVLNQNPQSTPTEIAKTTGISWGTAQRAVQQARDNGQYHGLSRATAESSASKREAA